MDDYEELMAFGQRIQEDREARFKIRIEQKNQDENWRRVIEHSEYMQKLRPDYCFINTPFVYFLRGDNGRVKIGYSWYVPARVKFVSDRIFEGNSRVIGLFRGGRTLEERLHKIFEDYRMIGTREIFFHNESMDTYLQNVMTDEEKELVQTANRVVFT